MEYKLHDYQKKAVKFALKSKSSFMMIDLGLGKTAIALYTMAVLKREAPTTSTLVLAPLRVCYSTWPEEIKRWMPHLSYTILHGPQKAKRLQLKRDVYIMNYDGLKWFYHQVTTGKFNPGRMHLVVDESSFVKSPSTQRFKMLKKMYPMWTSYKMLLSATPAPNGLHELWSQFYLLDQGLRLGRAFYTHRQNYFNYTGPPIYKTTPRHDTADRIYSKVKDITYRLDAEDYIKMPPIIYNKIPLVLPPALQHNYDELEKNFFIELGDDEVEVFNAAALSSKLRQYIQGCVYTNKNGDYTKVHNIKIEALKELREQTSQPILCPIQFKFELRQIEKQIKGVPIIAGQTKGHEAAVYIREWNRGNIPLLLCHPASLGHGVNLQTGGHILLWFGLTWSLEQYMQMNGRLHRQGQQHGVTVHHLVMQNTLDEAVLKALNTKHQTQSGFLNTLRRYRNG